MNAKKLKIYIGVNIAIAVLSLLLLVVGFLTFSLLTVYKKEINNEILTMIFFASYIPISWVCFINNLIIKNNLIKQRIIRNEDQKYKISLVFSFIFKIATIYLDAYYLDLVKMNEEL